MADKVFLTTGIVVQGHWCVCVLVFLKYEQWFGSSACHILYILMPHWEGITYRKLSLEQQLFLAVFEIYLFVYLSLTISLSLSLTHIHTHSYALIDIDLWKARRQLPGKVGVVACRRCVTLVCHANMKKSYENLTAPDCC